MTNPAPVIVITGPSGAGKSTVARRVADRLHPGVHLHTDDFFGYIRGLIAPYLPESQRQNETVVGVYVTAAFGYAAGGYQVVVDGVVGPWFLDRFLRASADTGQPLHYIVLRPTESVTVSRAGGRGTEALADATVVRGLHRSFRELGELERNVLDTSLLTPDQTADAVLAGVADGDFLLGVDVHG